MKLESLVLTALTAVLTLSSAKPEVLAAQAAGRITGTVTNAQGNGPIVGAQVNVEGTTRTATTGQNGQYTLENVPVGTYTVRAYMIGHSTERREDVRIAAGATTTLNFTMRAQALAIDEIVVTGVTDPTSGVRVPFTVGNLSREAIQEVPPSGSPLAALQGKMAGVSVVRGGQPGSGVSVQLRTPTSIQKSNSPLIVVDGVITAASSVDIEALDIESMEVLKGAAAASLYGSRAAAGVIQIRTARGKNVQEGKMQLTVRSEIGESSLGRTIPVTNAHEYRVNANGQFVTATGALVTTRGGRVVTESKIQENPFVGEVFNAQEQFNSGGLFRTNSVSLAQNTGNSNYYVSFVNQAEPGIILENDGLTRNDFRVNLDQRVGDKLTLGFTAYHMRSSRDDIGYTTAQNVAFFQDALLTPRDINLLARDSAGNYIQQPDPTAVIENPIWRLTSREISTKRERTIAGANARYSPLYWLSVDGDVGYDRSNRLFSNYIPKGTIFLSGTDPLGQLNRQNIAEDAFNGSLGATGKFTLGDLTGRATVRGQMERTTGALFSASGQDLVTRGVPDLDQARTRFVSSADSAVRSTGYFANTGLDYAGKYIFDGLVRRDGSSLFGPEERWQTYYRASAAWRMAEEPWWPLKGIDEFKPRYSVGTAGGRPAYADQFEVYTVSSTGAISTTNKGNRFLKPEYSREQEIGLDIVGFNRRVSLQLNYAHVVTRDQIIQLPPKGATGFFSQWANGGTMEGNTWEAQLEAQLINRRNLSWSAGLIGDRSRHEITEWNRSCFVTGITYRCQGETLGLFYGRRHITSPDQLPARHANTRDQFAVNDQGYVVWVGSNPVTAGLTRNAAGQLLWNTSGTVDGVTYRWGMPIVQQDSTGQPLLVRVGDTHPKFHWGLSNNVKVGGFSFYGLLDSQVGAQVYNSVRQRLYQYFLHADVDQTGKPEELKKPIDYYTALYNGNNVTEHFVEDGTYVKLRELSVRYGIDQSRFGMLRNVGVQRASIGVVGRNLFTWTRFTGFDPEVGSVNSAEQDFEYPNFRTFTASIELQF